jgi:hypothetical protein
MMKKVGMQNAECRTKKSFIAVANAQAGQAFVLHSAFRILHSLSPDSRLLAHRGRGR